VQDVRKALEIYSEVFLTTRTGTEERILKLYHEVVKTKEAWYLQELTAKINEASVKKFSSDWVRKVLLQRLMDIGYVTVEADSEDKRLNVYKPLVKEEKELEEIHRFLGSPLILSSKLEEGFKKWLENIGGKEGLEIKTKIFAYKTLDEAKETWSETEISIHEFSNMVLGSNSEIFSSISEQSFPPIFFKPKEGSDSEKKPEIRGETVFRQSSANSDLPKGLYECEYCKAQGKPMFFATVEDLKGHIRAFHGGYPDKPDYVR
jgi:DNA-binding MarR family transcriptional regulator